MSERQAKRQKILHNPFIDAEAVVDDDDDEILEQEEDDFNKDEEILDSAEFHTRLALRMEEDDEAGLWAGLLERANSRSRHRPLNYDIDVEDDTYVLKASNGLWEIGCKIGHEDIAVYKILQASFDGASLARSAIAHPGMPGRIYAEVDTIAQARRLAQALDELNPWALRGVPFDELLVPLRIKRGPSLRPYAWVKVCDWRKRWAKYRGDVGIVRTRNPDNTYNTFGNKMFIYLVPRLYFPSDHADESQLPPPQRLATRDIMQTEFGKEYLGLEKDIVFEDPLTFSFKGLEYDALSGLLVVEAEDIAVVAEPGLLPSRMELCLMHESEFLPENVYLETMQVFRSRRLGIGSRVKVTAGDFKGLVGLIRDQREEPEECVVELPTQGLIEDIPLRHLRANFRIGDWVRTVSGDDMGIKGWIISIFAKGKTLVILNAEDTQNPVLVRVSYMDVEFHDDNFITMTLRPRRARRRNLGPKDPNSVYIGKQVLVLDRNLFKGYKGLVKNTSPDGHAWVELEATLISHNRVQVIKIEHLGIRQPDSSVIRAHPISVSRQPQISEDKRSVILREAGLPSLTVAGMGGSTPLPTNLSSIGLSPAWDPSSRTPLPEPSSPARESTPLPPPAPSLCLPRREQHWLEDDLLQNSRIMLKRIKGHDMSVEFVKVDGDCAVIREQAVQLREPLENLTAVQPSRINDCVILLAGSDKGKLFKVREFKDSGLCMVRRVGTRLLKGQMDPIYSMEELARTYLYH